VSDYLNFPVLYSILVYTAPAYLLAHAKLLISEDLQCSVISFAMHEQGCVKLFRREATSPAKAVERPKTNLAESNFKFRFRGESCLNVQPSPPPLLRFKSSEHHFSSKTRPLGHLQ